MIIFYLFLLSDKESGLRKPRLNEANVGIDFLWVFIHLNQIKSYVFHILSHFCNTAVSCVYEYVWWDVSEKTSDSHPTPHPRLSHQKQYHCFGALVFDVWCLTTSGCQMSLQSILFSALTVWEPSALMHFELCIGSSPLLATNYSRFLYSYWDWIK